MAMSWTPFKKLECGLPHSPTLTIHQHHHPHSINKKPGFSSPYPPDCKCKGNAEGTSHTFLTLRPGRRARPVLILLLILTGPADTHASQVVQHSWAALFFNKELGYLDLPFLLLVLHRTSCPQDYLLGFPLLTAL